MTISNVYLIFWGAFKFGGLYSRTARTCLDTGELAALTHTPQLRASLGPFAVEVTAAREGLGMHLCCRICVRGGRSC